ncbi:MAG: HAMP domain-containing histidine kinase [Alphaproteobacteria bacterium]|nr:HAMP domain-containing histidine kinase [Alphaproteobacteria bacterium]
MLAGLLVHPVTPHSHAARLVREQIVYAIKAMNRGIPGVLVLAGVLAVAVNVIPALGPVPLSDSALFCGCVATWCLIARALIHLYERQEPADRALPIWKGLFSTLFLANGICWALPVFILWVDGSAINNFAVMLLSVFCIANASNEHGDDFGFFLSLAAGCFVVTMAGILLHPSPVRDAGLVLVPAGSAWFALMATHARRRFTELVLTRLTNEDLVSGARAARDEALENKARAESASNAKSAFLANMSHELRTPLNAIIGFSQIVRDEMFGPLGNARYKTYVSDIETSGQHLLGIINDLLDVAKIEAGRMELKCDWTAPEDFIQAAIQVVRGHPAAAGARITTDFGHGSSRVYADGRMMRQTLVNLLSNAVKHNLPGEPISVSTRLGADGALRIVVADRGVGIPAHLLDKVFEVFEQADNSYAREKQGTGLGLALVRAFVTAHGGKVWLESEPGAGTRAIIELPRPTPAALSRAA